jgi:hypothetical protein
MATSPNFNWPEPDNTDLVKNGALAIRTAVDAIDTSMTDLLGGTTGQVLAKTSATDMDFTWTTPAGGGGKVLQVVQATYSTATTINGGALADTGLSASITPSASTSKVLILVSQYYKNTSSAGATEVGAQMKLLRGASGIAGDGTNLYFEYFTGPSSTYDKRFIWNLHYLDSPATTSATTYKTQAKNYSASIVAQSDSTMSTIILMEIGA